MPSKLWLFTVDTMVATLIGLYVKNLGTELSRNCLLGKMTTKIQSFFNTFIRKRTNDSCIYFAKYVNTETEHLM